MAAPFGSSFRPERTGGQTKGQNQSSVNPAAASPLVRRQGHNWALPAEMAGRGGNEIVRTIRVQCYPDRLVMLPARSGGATEVFGLSNGNVDQSTLRLATAVRDRIKLWGPALPGGRWQPRLDVVVMPQGNARFEQLRAFMIGSGVEVIGRTSR
jgi:hypothetical protein